MTTVSHGKPYAGNPHVRIEEGASAPAEPRRNALLHEQVETGLDMHNRVTGEMLAHILRLQLRALKEHPEMAKTLPPLMVWGAPGLGKSSILQQAAREEGIGFIDVRLAQREPVDIRGKTLRKHISV